MSPNADPHRRFLELFKWHWDAGTGLDPKLRGPKGEWTNAAYGVVQARLSGPNTTRLGAALAAFCPPGMNNAALRKELTEAWEEGERTSGTAPAPNRQPSEDPNPPRWDRVESWGTPRLATHGMADPAPLGNSDNGHYRIAGQPIVNVVEAANDGRYVRVGVNNVQVLLESTAYDIHPNSRVTEQENKPRIEMLADGVHVHAGEPDASLNGPLWDYGDVVVVQRNAKPDGPIEMTLRAGRRSFLVAEVDRSGREKRVQVSPEETAIIEMILRKDPETDGLGDYVLAKVRWTRSTE